MKSTVITRAAASAAVLAALAAAPAARAETTVNVGVVNDFAGWNPYADSTAQMYMIWCQTYGCLGTFDTHAGEYKGILAERWEVDKNDRNLWTFHLRKGMKRHKDGKELTAEDVVHSINRVKTDPRSAQKSNIRPVKDAVVVDKYTVRVTTVEPTAPLLSYLFDRLIITGKDLFDKHGRDVDRKAPLGWGPYMVEDVTVGQRMVLRKVKDHPDVKPKNPDRLIFSRVKETEARVTGAINGELQIAQFIPPHLVDRVEGAPNLKVVSVPPVEVMFLAMNPKFKPWDNKKVRQAVAYAIDREAIVKSIFQGRAEVLNGPVGPGQYGYSKDFAPRYSYDPEKAKKLLAEAGYPNGVDVEFFTATNRYINDRQTSEAITAMLTKVGIRTKLNTPEYSTHWPMVQKGRVPFYYQGRGSVIDPSAFLHQYFQTGITPRISYSNPELDKLLKAEAEEFDEEKRKKLLLEASNLILEEMPALFLWRINMIYAIAKNIDFKPYSDDRVFGIDITVN